MHDEIFALIAAGVLFVLSVMYGFECLRWAKQVEKRCNEIRRWYEDQMKDGDDEDGTYLHRDILSDSEEVRETNDGRGI